MTCSRRRGGWTPPETINAPCLRSDLVVMLYKNADYGQYLEVPDFSSAKLKQHWTIRAEQSALGQDTAYSARR